MERLTPKEITINYLESIQKDRQAIGSLYRDYAIEEEIEVIEKAVKIVKESEGE